MIVVGLGLLTSILEDSPEVQMHTMAEFIRCIAYILTVEGKE